MSQKVTYEEFMDRLSNCTNTIVIMSEFLGLHKPLKCKCLVCGYEWTTSEARSILRYGCKKCMDKIRCKNSGVSNRKSEEQFRSELAIAQPNLMPNDTYVNGKTKYHCICKIHKCDVYKTPQKLLLRGQGCNLCSIEKNKCAVRYTHTTFCEKVKMLHPNINVISEYKNIKANSFAAIGFNYYPDKRILFLFIYNCINSCNSNHIHYLLNRTFKVNKVNRLIKSHLYRSYNLSIGA